MAKPSSRQLLHPPAHRRYRYFDPAGADGSVQPHRSLHRAVPLPGAAFDPCHVDLPGRFRGGGRAIGSDTIEQEVNGVNRMIYMKSSNTSDGRMQLDVNFEVGVDQDTANVLTQNRVSSRRRAYPKKPSSRASPSKTSRAF